MAERRACTGQPLLEHDRSFYRTFLKLAGALILEQAAVLSVNLADNIMATAVGARILKFIVPNIVEGLRKRWQRGGEPLNIIICENLMDANKVLEGMIKAQLTEEEKLIFDERVGLVEASIGRMVYKAACRPSSAQSRACRSRSSSAERGASAGAVRPPVKTDPPPAPRCADPSLPAPSGTAPRATYP